MGSTKSLRYEVLVYQTPSTSAFKEQQHHQQPSTSSLLPNDDNNSSLNHSASATLFETKVQRFTCDRENMQQYWIPEGFHPVLIPRAYLTDSLVPNNSRHLMNPIVSDDIINQLRSRINNNNNDDNINDIELRRRRRNVNNNNISTSCINNNNHGGISKKKRRNNNDVNRRTILGQSSPTVNNQNNNINTLIYRQKLKERISALRNSAVTISSNSSLKNTINSDHNLSSSPSIIIGEMWKDEPDNVKKHYERLAIRKKIAQALAFEQKFSSSNSSCGKINNNNCNIRSTTTTTTINSRRQHHVNPVTNNNNTGTSCRFNNNVVECVDAVDFDNVSHQNVNNSVTCSHISSSPKKFSNKPMPDLMTRSDVEDYYNGNSNDIELKAENISY